MTVNYKHKKHSVYGCKTRVVSKLYVHTPGLRKLYGRDLGKVLGELINDPPVEIDDPSYWGLSPQGINVIPDNDGIYHAWDWIGADNYYNAADIWMQVIEKDDNALVPITKDLQLLTEFESFRVLVHPHGSVTQDIEKYKTTRVKVDYVPECFLEEGDFRDMHLALNDQMCSSLWWQMCKGKVDEDDGRYVNVEVGDMSYRAGGIPVNHEPAWKLAITGKVPISELHYVVGDMSKNEADVNQTIELALEQLGGMDLNLPLFATDN